MLVRRVSSVVSVLAGVAALMLAPPAQAVDCPQVEVIFARGRVEPPGVGWIGDAFVNDLRSKTDKTVGVYPVNYPADTEVIEGANDMSKRIQYMAANCPNTRLVLGGYSQGAAVMDIITSVPFPAIGFTNPLPPNAPARVAAVAVFGNPTAKIGLPLTSSPVYGTRAIDLCNVGDPVCSDGNNVPAHRSYGPDGLTNQAAAFVASLL